MTHTQIFGSACWITTQTDSDAALFRSVFDTDSISTATINICGLGYFELYINGLRVGNDCFVPAYSDYHNRPDMTLIYPLNDKWQHRIYCMQYDITKYIHIGKNVIGVAVGGGFYHQIVRNAEGNVNYGNIKLCFKIDIGGKEVVFSTENVKYQSGFFKSSNLFYGETLDYTDFDRSWNKSTESDKGWKSTKSCTAPESDYYIQQCPTDKVVETLKPELIKNFGEYSVYSVPKNISGYPVVRCNKTNEKVIVECCEEIFDDKNLNNRSVGYGEQRQIETFITDGSSELYRPYFCWFGFRYFSVTNNAVPIEVRVIHSDINVTSDFQCSDETLNWYYKTFINTQLCNMHGSIPSDCPHRERLGYTGDGQLTCDAVMTMTDSESFYRKWIYDISDCQDSCTGHVQHTAPFAGGGGGPVGWGGAIIVLPYTFYRHYGDKKFLKEFFPKMDLFTDYIESRCSDGLIVCEEKDGWCLGDWCAPEAITIPEDFVNTTMFISQLKMLVFCADALGIDNEKYIKLIKLHANAVHKKYYDEQSCFLNGIQGSNAFAANCGIETENALANVISKYSQLGEFDTGIFGTYILLNLLFKTGNGDLATSLLANKKTVSFETMRKAGASTLWENWNGKASHSHPMFGASTQYLFEYILGIRQNDDSVKYDKITINPVYAQTLDYAFGYITTPHGKISVKWKKDNGKIHVEIELENDMNAEFVIKNKIVKLNIGKNCFEL